jgi:hypothetical protein
MARFARGTSLVFLALVAIIVAALSGACTSLSNPPMIADCIDPAVCQSGVATPSPMGRSVPPPDAGASTGTGTGIGPGPVPEAGVPQGTLPEAGAGPGIGMGASGPPGTDVTPVCPALAPTNGAPCDPVANSLPCAFARLTCFCTGAWTCF